MSWRADMSKWMGSTGCVVDRLVELAGTSDGRPFGGLRLGRHGPSCGVHQRPELRPSELSSLSPHNSDNAHTRLHQQYAYKMDCELQFRGVHFQHHRSIRHHNPHTSQYQQRKPRITEVYFRQSGVGRFLRWDRLSKRRLSSDDLCGSDMDNEVCLKHRHLVTTYES